MGTRMLMIGCGNMGGAMLKGWLAGGLAPEAFTVVDPYLDAAPEGVAVHAALFGEDQARYLVAVKDAAVVLEAAKAAGVSAAVIGQAGGEDIAVDGLFALPLAKLRSAHEGWMPEYMGG